jgi:hypothetical protein
MRNKEIYQQKVTRLESLMNAIKRAVNTNDRQEASNALDVSKELLSDLQTMINREQTTYK